MTEDDNLCLQDLLGNPHPPVAIYRSETIPEGSERPAREHCAIKGYFLPAVMEGKSICGGPEDIFCGGPKSGFCIGVDPVRDELAECYAQTGYFESPELARRNYTDVVKGTPSDEYIVFEPLARTRERGIDPDVVVFLADPLHISALMDLAGYARRTDDEPVAMRYALACEQLYLLPLIEGRKENPKCILGLTELFVRKLVDSDKFSFAIPYGLYRTMESNAGKSFLTKRVWTG
ncbi:MAG: DUF169 domain-containing protein [archaeon]|nr:DUF169 domain-containing protein [archaeon]